MTFRRPAAPYGNSEPISPISSDRYQDEYIESFVAKWDQLIDWDRRAAAEGDFFIETLKVHGARSVLDVATGTGFHSVRLMQAGFAVTSADGNARMLERAHENAWRAGLTLRPVHADWRTLGQHVGETFDAIICLGNSFTHLFDEDDRRTVLNQYIDRLAPGGLLILDQRNYDALLDHGTQPRHKYYYCGKNVCARPLSVNERRALFRYEFSDQTVFHLTMFPLRRDYTRRLLTEAGFGNIRTFGDFKATYIDTEPDFLIHIAQKVASSATEHAKQ